MPRIRSIKPDFWKSEKVAVRLPGKDGRAARQLFIALWNFAEDHGVARGNPAYLRAEIYPYDDDVTTADVVRWLEALQRGGFIVRFERDDSSFLWIRGFNDHQRIEKPSKPTLPSPTTDERKGIKPTPVALPESSPTPPEKERMDRRGEEGRGEEEEKDPSSAEPTGALFELVPEEVESPEAVEVFTHWRQVMGKNGRTAFDRKRKSAVQARLRDGYSVDDLKRAVDGCAKTPHNMGQNDRGERFDDLELICRDSGRVDRFMYNATSPPVSFMKAPVRKISAADHTEVRSYDNDLK